MPGDHAAALTGLRAWRDRRSAEAAAGGAPMFMGLPDAWFENPHWLCPGGHVSTVYLRRDSGEPACLACGIGVVLGPPITEATFMALTREENSNAQS